MILANLDEATTSGARLDVACAEVGLDVRTIQRWRRREGGDDGRCGPKQRPGNALSETERRRVVEIANLPGHRDLSPKQIVPRLADEGMYVASESTFYRILRAEGQLAHRESARPATKAAPREHVATAIHQVWSWDITYLRAAVRGTFYYLYMVEDIWSRKIVGWEVHDEESMEKAATLIDRTAARLGIAKGRLVLHSDNGGPMKGSTMLATLQRLGIVPSFSRPRVSDDNPYSESLFRTMKYRPGYPRRPFASLDEARTWVASFVDWYNSEHLHSAIGFVTPAERHAGRDAQILERRRAVYEAARRRRPERWTRHVRKWKPVDAVHLNPEAGITREEACRQAA
jgi:transposase InsO family protein